ncbi:MAG: hypothetical protein HY283_01885 [Nitrospirae bacterium]|nr:hypothetical protein [Nitrospirota bacterium]
MQPALDHLQRTRLALYTKLRFHETGASRPDLNGIRAVVFWLADPLREQFPECFQEASELNALARERSIPTINPPESLSNSIKSVQARLWREAGIPTPDHRRFESREELVRALNEVRFPLIVRPDELHSQIGMRISWNRAEVEAFVDHRFGYPGTFTSFVDVREGYRATAPGTVWAHYYHKKRALVLGPIVLANEVFFSSHPIVASQTCTFGWYDRGRVSLGRLAPWLPWERRCLEADREFSEAGPVHANLMRESVSALGLAFAAIDYADLADGGVVLWEANPYFYLPPLREMFLPGPRRIQARLEVVYEAVGNFFQDLLHGAAPPEKIT